MAVPSVPEVFLAALAWHPPSTRPQPMAVTFSEIGGKWTFKARVHPKGQGAVYKSPSRLWDTQEDAEKDVGLFIWYKSAKSKDKNLMFHCHMEGGS